VRVLLDTHPFLWWAAGDDRLPQRVRRLIADTRNDVFFSVVSAWEITIKTHTGGLELADPPERLIPKELEASGLATLPLYLRHVYELTSLPAHHHDPFDRMLVAQAVSERMTLVTGDGALQPYPVRLYW
jgi:PIN domain nuclease of toxin-antitoxin system